MLPRSLLVLAALLLGAASAHAYLERSEPAANSLVTERPATLELHYTMAVETRFSTFKVYPLEVEAPFEDPENPTERERQRLNALAAQLVAEVLQARGDDDARADAGLVDTGRTTREVTLALREDLAPGVFVVMWRVLAIDTHWTEDFFVFTLLPDEDPPNDAG